MNEKVHTSRKLSCDFLESEEAKSLFFTCSLHEEDANSTGIENFQHPRVAAKINRTNIVELILIPKA